MNETYRPCLLLEEQGLFIFGILKLILQASGLVLYYQANRDHAPGKRFRNISQIVICSKIKHAPNVLAFTEQGVAMLSGILNSDRAIEVNIQIMRVFVRLRATVACPQGSGP